MRHETGVYVDSWRGVYADAAVLEMSNGFGFEMTADEFAIAAKEPYSRAGDDDELLRDLVQRAQDWLNANEADEGCSWYWFDGMFGYWPEGEDLLDL